MAQGPTPAGWYPDPDQPGMLRYWDGTAWTRHQSPAPTGTAGAYRAGGPAGRTSHTGTIVAWALSVTAAALVITALAIGLAKDAGPSTRSMPTSQQNVMRSLTTAQRLVTDNEVRAKALEAERDDEICTMLGPSGDVTGWVGRVTEVGTTIGHRTLTLDIGNHVKLGTASSRFTDLSGPTTIEPADPVYSSITGLDVGETVTFDGTFALRESCIVVDDGDLKRPELRFRFTRVTPAG